MDQRLRASLFHFLYSAYGCIALFYRSHTHTHTHTFSLYLSLSHTHTHTHSLSLSHKHTHILSLSLTHTHTHSLSLSLSLSLTHTHTHTNTHTHTLHAHTKTCAVCGLFLYDYSLICSYVTRLPVFQTITYNEKTMNWTECWKRRSSYDLKYCTDICLAILRKTTKKFLGLNWGLFEQEAGMLTTRQRYCALTNLICLWRLEMKVPEHAPVLHRGQ